MYVCVYLSVIAVLQNFVGVRPGCAFEGRGVGNEYPTPHKSGIEYPPRALSTGIYIYIRMYTCTHTQTYICIYRYVYTYTHIPDTEVVRLLHESLSIACPTTLLQSCRKHCLAGQLSADKTAFNLAPSMGVSELKRSQRDLSLQDRHCTDFLYEAPQLALIVRTKEPCIGFRSLGTQGFPRRILDTLLKSTSKPSAA